MMNILLCLLMPAGNDRIQMRYNTEDKNFRNRWHHEISISLQAITYLSMLNQSDQCVRAGAKCKSRIFLVDLHLCRANP